MKGSDAEGFVMVYSDVEGTGCSTCKGLVLELIKDAEETEQVEAPDSDTARTEEDKPDYAAAPIDLLWPNGQVFQVWILNTTDRRYFKQHIELVKEVVKEWEKHANISFTFPEEWDPNSPPEVRLRFWDKQPGFKPEQKGDNTDDGNWSYVGNSCQEIIQDGTKPNFWKPTMNLQRGDLSRPGPLESFKATILHEFGHMLGFMHEHQRPDAEFKFKYNTQKLYEWYERKYGWGLPKVYEQVFNFEENEGRVFAANALDTKSIMMYSVPAEILEAGSPAIPPNYVLSDGDKKWVARLYPQKGERQPWKPEEIIYG